MDIPLLCNGDRVSFGGGGGGGGAGRVIRPPPPSWKLAAPLESSHYPYMHAQVKYLNCESFQGGSFAHF